MKEVDCMGCDIHLHIEIKMNGLWRHYSMPHIERDYCLFGVMAGVRGNKDDMIVAPSEIHLNKNTYLVL